MNPADTFGDRRIFLIDGMSQIFRAFYAIRGLSTAAGLPTNATFGFITMLRKLVEEEKPSYLGVVFDPEGPTVRHRQYQDYKAHRRPTPPELIIQLPQIRRFCDAMNIPVLIEPEYEADDVIGTLASKAEAEGFQVVIVTIDKDMFQLVSPSTRILDTRQDNRYLDRDQVIEKMGVPPEQIVDLLGLWGDASDNIPGAPGIGEKGALELIRRFGNIEECLQHWPEVERKSYRESLRDHADLIRKSRELARIHRDLPMPLDLEQLRVGPADRGRLLALYRELEFSSLARTLEAATAAPAAPPPEVDSLGRGTDWTGFELREGPAAFLVVTGEKGPGLAVAAEGGVIGWIPPGTSEQELRSSWLKLGDRQGPLLTHDYKSALLAILPLAEPADRPVDDLMIMAYLANPLQSDFSLTTILGEELTSQAPELFSNPGRVAQQMLVYGPRLTADLDGLGLRQLYQEIELPLVRVLAEMEHAGVRVDPASLGALAVELDQQITARREEIFQAAGTEFNLDSPKQVGEILFEKLHLPVLKRTRKTKGYSTDQEVLEELAASFRVPQLLLDYRQMTKLKSTYIDALPRLIRPATGRVHTSFNQTVAATGRLSSSNPNLQNIPIRTELGRRIRQAFVAAPGHRFVAADYSQIELRIMAHLTGDPAMVDAFLRNQDIHQRTALEVFGMAAQMNPAEYRRRAKVINFGILYGLSAFGLAKQLQIGRAEAQRFIDSYFDRYRGIRVWLDEILQQARATGAVRTLLGRVRPVPELSSPDRNVRAFGERVVTNTPIQGTAADLIKLAMVRLHRRLREEKLCSRLVLQVHDELLLECPENEVSRVADLVREVMEGVYPLKVPLRVDVGTADNWKDLK